LTEEDGEERYHRLKKKRSTPSGVASFSSFEIGMWATAEYAKIGERLVARWIDVASSKAQLDNREKANW